MPLVHEWIKYARLSSKSTTAHSYVQLFEISWFKCLHFKYKTDKIIANYNLMGHNHFTVCENAETSAVQWDSKWLCFQIKWHWADGPDGLAGTFLPWTDSSPSGLVTESFPPKSELHSDRRSSILFGMSSEVALIPRARKKGLKTAKHHVPLRKRDIFLFRLSCIRCPK